MEPDKEHIRYCLLLYFHQKKSASDIHRVVCETYDENVIAIRTCANWFKQFKNVISISVTKNASDAVQLWKRTNCGNIRKKSWKILRLIYIVSIFIIIKKNCKKFTKIFASIT